MWRERNREEEREMIRIGKSFQFNDCLGPSGDWNIFPYTGGSGDFDHYFEVGQGNWLAYMITKIYDNIREIEKRLDRRKVVHHKEVKVVTGRR